MSVSLTYAVCRFLKWMAFKIRSIGLFKMESTKEISYLHVWITSEATEHYCLGLILIESQAVFLL